MSFPWSPPTPTSSLAGRFRLLRRIGAGGMGEVWVAEQLSLGRKVAVKLLAAESASDPEASIRFEREAKSLSRVDHDHVVRVLDFGKDETYGWFLATELLEGETLGSLIQREGRLSTGRAIAILSQILDGLGAVHALDVVHRDLKPDNVMLTLRDDGSVFAKLLDFGIVKLLDAQGLDLTRTGLVFGTPSYLSPEQALARPVDHRSDLYACGVILYQMLSGTLPFDAQSPGALALLHATEAPPPLPGDLVPQPLARVISRALEKDPDSRFPDAQAMRNAVIEAGSELPLRITLDVIRSPTISQQLPPTRPLPAGPILRTEKSATRTILAARFQNHPQEKDPHPLALTPSDLVTEIVQGFRGRISFRTSTSLLAEMVSPTDALLCAATLHDRFAMEKERFQGGASLQVAITTGEVLRQRKRLLGQAVGQAGVLVEETPPGEVLFSHGVYLSMIRSEVVCEPYKGVDPGIGQRVHRLLPFANGPFPGLPFGGTWVRRGRIGPMRRSVRFTSKLLHAAARTTRRGMKRGRLAGRRGMALAVSRPILSSAIAVFVFVVLLSFLAFRPSGPEAKVEEALAADRLKEAQALVDAWMRERPEPLAHAWKGRILLAEGNVEEARDLLVGALEMEPALADDPGVARAMVRLLDERGADSSWIVQVAGPAVEGALLEATSSARYWQRWNAARALERLGGGARIDRVNLYLLDLHHAASCGTRVRAARELGKIGRGDARVLPSLRDAREKGFPGAACNLRQTLNESIDSLRRR